MPTDRETLLGWIDSERDEMVAFLQRFVRAKSPNPPGDTTEAVGVIRAFLDSKGLPYRMVAPQPTMANVVGTFQGGAGPGKRLVLNGHIDVFPVGDGAGWSHDPWGGEIHDGKIYGRGVADMKCGTTASIMTFALLHRLKDRLKGSLTLTAVSDEETFGPWGARYVIENVPEALGDCCLNGEPSSPYTVRFGEKGPLWLAFTVKTPGAHGAYTHFSTSATLIASRLIVALGAVESLPVELPHNVMRAIEDGKPACDVAMGKGAGETVSKVTLNVGVIAGGMKVNMIPGECRFEADIRLPPGMTKEKVMAKVGEILKGFPEATVEEINSSAPSYCDPFGDMIEIVRRNVEQLRGFKPTPVVSLGGTDTRLWRYRNIPAYVYGPFPHGMGTIDEHVQVDEFLHIVRTHAVSAYDYLMAS